MSKKIFYFSVDTCFNLWNDAYMKFEIKKLSVQERLSEETLCFSADIWVDGKKIGEVTNRGHGGCNNYYWHDAVKGKELEDYAKRTVTKYNFDQLDILIGGMIATMQAEKDMKRWCKTKTVFTLLGDIKGEFRTVKHVFTPEVKAWLVAKYGAKIDKIYNETV